MRGQAQALSSARGAGAGSDDWGSPAVVLDRVRSIGEIVLDPCTSGFNTVSSIASCDITAGEDGLLEDWLRRFDGIGVVRGVTYVNPPYSKMAAWAAKMAAEALVGCPIIALVAARPDTKWSRLMWDAADAVAFWRGRLKFVGAPSPAPFPSAVFGFNVSQRRFRAAFGDVATVVLP